MQRAAEHSLFLRQNSLFFENFSLLSSLGSCSNNHCGAVVSCSEIGGLGRKAAVFLVKFPVCREFTCRLVRTALGRQPKFTFVSGAFGNPRHFHSERCRPRCACVLAATRKRHELRPASPQAGRTGHRGATHDSVPGPACPFSTNSRHA